MIKQIVLKNHSCCIVLELTLPHIFLNRLSCLVSTSVLSYQQKIDLG